MPSARKYLHWVRSKLGPEWPIFLVVAVALFVHYRAVFSLQPLAGGDWDYFNTETLKQLFPHFSTVRTQVGFGTIDPLFLVRAPLFWLMGALAWFGIGFNVSERLFYLLPAALLPGIFSYHLLRQWFSRFAATMGALFAVTNTYWLIRSQSHFSIIIADSVLLLILAEITASSRRAGGDRLRLLSMGVLSGVLAWHEIRLLPIIILAALGYLVFFRLSRVLTWRRVWSIIWPLGLGFSLLQLPWLIVLAVSGGDGVLTELASSKVWITFQTLWHALTATSPFWSPNGAAPFVTGPLPKYFLLLPVLVIWAFFARFRKEPSSSPFWYFLLLYAVGVVLGKQEASPFTTLYNWLFQHVPGFALYREGTKFYGLIIAGLIFFVAFAFDRLLPKWQTRSGLIWRSVICLWLLAIYAVSSKPAILGTLGENFIPTSESADVNAIDGWLKTGQAGRVLWLPIHPQFTPETTERPRLDWNTWLEAKRSLDPIYLARLGVKSIVVPPDPQKNIYSSFGNRATFTRQLDNFSARESHGGAEVAMIEGGSGLAGAIPWQNVILATPEQSLVTAPVIDPAHPSVVTDQGTVPTFFPWSICKCGRTLMPALPEPATSNVLPGNSLYGLKRLRENYQRQGQPTDGEKLLFDILLLRKRYAESKALGNNQLLSGEIATKEELMAEALVFKLGPALDRLDLDGQKVRSAVFGLSADANRYHTQFSGGETGSAAWLFGQLAADSGCDGRTVVLAGRAPVADTFNLATRSGAKVSEAQIDGQTVSADVPVVLSAGWHVAKLKTEILPWLSGGSAKLNDDIVSVEVPVDVPTAGRARIHFRYAGTGGINLWVLPADGAVNDNQQTDPVVLDPGFGVGDAEIVMNLRPGQSSRFTLKFERQNRPGSQVEISDLSVGSLPQATVSFLPLGLEDGISSTVWRVERDKGDTIQLQAESTMSSDSLLTISRGFAPYWRLKLPSGQKLEPVAVDGQLLGFHLPANIQAGDKVVVTSPGGRLFGPLWTLSLLLLGTIVWRLRGKKAKQ